MIVIGDTRDFAIGFYGENEEKRTRCTTGREKKQGFVAYE